MKTWRTANSRRLCGYDPTHVVENGEAYLEIEDGAGKKRVRCAKCAVRHETHTAAEPPAELPTPEPEPDPEPVLESEGDPW